MDGVIFRADGSEFAKCGDKLLVSVGDAEPAVLDRQNVAALWLELNHWLCMRYLDDALAERGDDGR